MELDQLNTLIAAARKSSGTPVAMLLEVLRSLPSNDTTDGDTLRTAVSSAGAGATGQVKALLDNVSSVSRSGNQIIIKNKGGAEIPVPEKNVVVKIDEQIRFNVEDSAGLPALDSFEGLKASIGGITATLQKIQVAHRDGAPVLQVTGGAFGFTKTIDIPLPR